MVEIYLDDAALKTVEKALATLSGSGMNQALARAVNRAAQGVKTDASREVRKEYPGVKAGPIKKSFSVQRATRGDLTGTARSKGTRQPLILFGARPNKPEGRRPPVGASVQVSNQRKRIRGAFAARMGSGHVGLFVRSGDYGRAGDPDLERIQELFTFAVPQAVALTEERQGAVSEGVSVRFSKTLDHEMSRFLTKMGAR